MRVRLPALHGGPPVYALAGYSGTLRAVLIAYKERGHRTLARPLGGWLAAGLEGLPPGLWCPATGCWWLVPTPSRHLAAVRRGGQHVEAVAGYAAAALAGRGRPAAVAPALRMARGVRDQVGLGPQARRANLAGRVRLRAAGRPPPAVPVVLVDDVVTTGATVVECTEALTRAGVEVHAIVALAAAGGHRAWQPGGRAWSGEPRTGR